MYKLCKDVLFVVTCIIALYTCYEIHDFMQISYDYMEFMVKYNG
jgi:hypothetical protein